MQRIAGDNLALKLDQAQNLKCCVNLVAVLDFERGKRHAQARGIGRDHHLRRMAVAFIVGALEGFAIDGDNTGLAKLLDERRGQVCEHRIEGFRVDHAQHCGERVVRWNTVCELEEAIEKLEFCVAERGHLAATLGAAENRDEGDHKDFRQVVASVVGTRIGNRVEGVEKQLHKTSFDFRSPFKNL